MDDPEPVARITVTLYLIKSAATRTVKKSSTIIHEIGHGIRKIRIKSHRPIKHQWNQFRKPDSRQADAISSQSQKHPAAPLDHPKRTGDLPVEARHSVPRGRGLFPEGDGMSAGLCFAQNIDRTA